MIIKPNTEYRTRDGQKRGPLTWDGVCWWQDALGSAWYKDGRWVVTGDPHPYDLIAEWHEPQPAADGWIIHDGSDECPVHQDAIVKVQFLHRYVNKGRAGLFNWSLIVRYLLVAAPIDADGWIPWAGGECPVDGGTVVEVRYRNEVIEVCPARIFGWEHPCSDRNYDIIAYRLVTPAKDPAQRDTDQLARLGAHVAKAEPVDPPKSLRDEFAMAALTGILAGGFADTIPHDDVSAGRDVAFFANQYADAMMAARRPQTTDALRAGDVE